MTREVAIEERNNKLKHLITCMKCEVSGKSCDENCPNCGAKIEKIDKRTLKYADQDTMMSAT